MPNLAKTEPVALFTGFQTVILSAIVLLSAFDVWSPSEAQRNAILGAFVAITGWVGGIVRGAVTPTKGLHEKLEQLQAGQPKA